MQALPDLAIPLQICRPCFQTADMGLLQLQLGGILDCDQPLFTRYVMR